MAIDKNGVAVPAQSKDLDTTRVTTSYGLVHRQVITLADPETPTSYVTLTGSSLNVNISNASLAVTAASLPLPTGAATSALQTTSNSTLSAIDTKLGGTLSVNVGLTDAQLRASPVTVTLSGLGTLSTKPDGTVWTQTGTSANVNITNTSIAATQSGTWNITNISGTVSLPTGAATSALQTTGNTSLSNIDTKTPSLVGGRQPVLSQQYLTEVSRGNIAGETKLELRGYDKASSTTYDPIWSHSISGYPQPTTAQTLTLSSTSTNDTSAGTGARTVLVSYIEYSTGNEVTASYTLNGTTAVTVTTDGYAVNAMRVLTVGSNNSNVGELFVGYGTVTAGTPANILSSVDNGTNVSQQLIYTVPTGKTAEIHSYGVSVSKLMYVQFRIRPSKLSQLTYIEYDIPVNGVSPTPLLSVPIELTAGQQFLGYCAASGGTGLVAMVMRGVLRSV